MEPSEYKIEIPDKEVEDLRHRLSIRRLPGDLDNEQWGYGTNQDALERMLASWETYDWRSEEARINAYRHFRVDIGGQPIHYLRVEKKGSLPILMLGGWPWTFWDFADVIPQIENFELVVPDLPGYGFSSPLVRPGLGFVQTAEIFHELMTGVLGHSRYGVYGSDWGAFVAAQLAHTHADTVVGLHTTMPYPLDFAPVGADLWQPEEATRRAANEAWGQRGMGYFQMQASRPQTVAYLTDSPVAVAGWIVEKFHEWTDHSGGTEMPYPLDKMLATLSIYWYTKTLGSSARFYAESLRAPWSPQQEGTPVITVPTGVAAYPAEPAATPRKWAEGYYNLQRYTTMARGGHFPAVEDPNGLASEISQFFQEMQGQ